MSSRFFWRLYLGSLAAICIWFLTGCSSVTYTKNNAGDESFKYRRVGKQRVNAFKAGIDSNGVMNIEMKGQEGGSDIAMKALKAVLMP